MTLIVAGHETTATTCAWAIERLVRHPAALERLRADGDAYAQAVITETLRLRPPLWAVARVVRAPYALDGHVLAPGTHVVPYLPRLHRDPAAFPEPDAFRPERWLEDRPPQFAFAPFGGGVHRCLGEPFARFELAAMLATILSRVTLAPDDPRDEPVARRAIAHVPGRGCRVVAT
jgi:cytochrome P450